MSLIQQDAEWVHARSGGAISHEVSIEPPYCQRGQCCDGTDPQRVPLHYPG